MPHVYSRSRKSMTMKKKKESAASPVAYHDACCATIKTSCNDTGMCPATTVSSSTTASTCTSSISSSCVYTEEGKQRRSSSSCSSHTRTSSSVRRRGSSSSEPIPIPNKDNNSNQTVGFGYTVVVKQDENDKGEEETRQYFAESTWRQLPPSGVVVRTAAAEHIEGVVLPGSIYQAHHHSAMTRRRKSTSSSDHLSVAMIPGTLQRGLSVGGVDFEDHWTPRSNLFHSLMEKQ